MARGKWLSGAERERILELQRDGLSISAIAARVNRSYHFVYRHLRGKYGVKRAQGEDDHALHRDSKRVQLADISVDGQLGQLCIVSKCSVVAPTWARRAPPSYEPLVVSASPMIPEHMETATAGVVVHGALAAVTEIDEGSCEPIPFTPLRATCPAVCTFPLPVALSSQVSKAQDTAPNGHLSPLKEIYDDEGRGGFDPAPPAPTVTPTEPSKPYQMWMNADDYAEEPPVPKQIAGHEQQTEPDAAIEPEQELESVSSDFSGLHSSLQEAIRHLSCQRSIGFYDAQLLQLLVQADVLLLTRQRSITRGPLALWDRDSQPEVGHDTQADYSAKQQPVALPSWVPKDESLR